MYQHFVCSAKGLTRTVFPEHVWKTLAQSTASQFLAQNMICVPCPLFCLHLSQPAQAVSWTPLPLSIKVDEEMPLLKYPLPADKVGGLIYLNLPSVLNLSLHLPCKLITDLFDFPTMGS